MDYCALKINMKHISIITPTFNEADNVLFLYDRIKDVCLNIPNYRFTLTFIDNDSSDGTQEILLNLALKDKSVRLIFNNRNFGHIRSPYWGILNTDGDATIYLASDLQDPPELFDEFIKKWEQGYKVVLAVKTHTEIGRVSAKLRSWYYKLLNSISSVPLSNDVTGFGLYDHAVIKNLRNINDPYPYLRGLVSELGYSTYEIPFIQKRRHAGVTKNNIFTLYDFAMLGIVSHSIVPLRIASFFGFIIGLISILLSLIVLALKITYWDSFPLGYAPFGILFFFLLGCIFMFIGMMGEYVGSMHTYLKNRPIVVEKLRVNFD